MKRLYLFPSCRVVRGYCRSIIVDTHRGNYKFIPNAMQQMLERCNGCSVTEIKNTFGAENAEIIDQYISFLIDNEFVFMSSNRLQFDYDSYRCELPYGIYDVQMEFDGHIQHEFLAALNSLNCQFVHIFVNDGASFDSLLELFRYMDSIRINGVYVTAPYHSSFDMRFGELWQTTVKLLQVVILNAPRFSEHQNGPNGYQRLYFFDAEQSQRIHCGGIAPHLFAPNADMIAHSMMRNSCLSGKIYIGAGGEIRPCRWSQKLLGNIARDSIELIVQSKSYAALSIITKDQVDVCCHCEFRRICPDCRVFTRHPERPTAHPARCTYNPYIARWQGQLGYVPVEQCGTFTPEGFMPNAERIERVLREQQGE